MIKPLEENTEDNLNFLEFYSILNGSQKNTWPIKEKFNELEFIEIKKLCSSKNTVTKMKRQATVWEREFAKPDQQRLLSQIYKELKRSK